MLYLFSVTLTGWCVENWIQIKNVSKLWSKYTQAKLSWEKKNGKVVQFSKLETGTATDVKKENKSDF